MGRGNDYVRCLKKHYKGKSPHAETVIHGKNGVTGKPEKKENTMIPRRLNGKKAVKINESALYRIDKMLYEFDGTIEDLFNQGMEKRMNSDGPEVNPMSVAKNTLLKQTQEVKQPGIVDTTNDNPFKKLADIAKQHQEREPQQEQPQE